MSHQPIFFKNLSLSFKHKTCFSGFSGRIGYRDKIAIIGDNGVGKSSLLRILKQEIAPSGGELVLPDDVHIGYVPQVIEDKHALSGGERFLKSLSHVLAQNINVLLLDEPTNHLDGANKRSLMKMLQRYQQTLVVVSHDEALLSSCVDKVWDIEGGEIRVFSGRYVDYVREKGLTREKSVKSFEDLRKERRSVRERLQFENERAGGRRRNHKNRHEKSKAHKQKMKETASKTSAKNQKKILALKKRIEHDLENFRRVETIRPTFTLSTSAVGGGKPLISIVEGAVRYEDSAVVLSHIYFSVGARERVHIRGKNGAGKTSLIRAIMHEEGIIRTGLWQVPKRDLIGYLDQHYATLDPELTVMENLHRVVPAMSEVELRKVLSTFLFKTHEEVARRARDLSGGERARLSLAQIAVKTPPLLVLDEVTNNIDLKTKRHLMETLQAYPGALLIISHDESFLEQLALDKTYDL